MSIDEPAQILNVLKDDMSIVRTRLPLRRSTSSTETSMPAIANGMSSNPA